MMPAYMTQGDRDATGRVSSGETLTPINPVCSVFHKVAREGNLGLEQKEELEQNLPAT